MSCECPECRAERREDERALKVFKRQALAAATEALVEAALAWADPINDRGDVSSGVDLDLHAAVAAYRKAKGED